MVKTRISRTREFSTRQTTIMATTSTTKRSRKIAPKPVLDLPCEQVTIMDSGVQDLWNTLAVSDFQNCLPQVQFQSPIELQNVQVNQSATKQSPIRSTLNRLCNTEFFGKYSTKPLNELEIDVNYPIQDIRSVFTRYGRKIVLDLLNGWSVFLPQRYAKLSEDQIQQMNEEKLSLVYSGKQINNEGYECYKIKFV